MDNWAHSKNNTNQEKVIAQISDGKTPEHIESSPFMDGKKYNETIRNASVFVSHAGMGNIISAREQDTPIIVMNRQYKLGEHRNDHQADGLKWMAKMEGVYTASTQQELYQHLSHIEKLETANSANKVGNSELTNHIADFINSGKV